MSTKSICIFCGSKTSPNNYIMELASAVGSSIARENIKIICGGGRMGLMGVVTESAIAAGGFVTGIFSDVLKSETPNTEATSLLRTPCLQTRKKEMIEISDAFLVLPGGYGTLDELFEVIVLHKIKVIKKPIVLFNYLGFWDHTIMQIKHMQEEGFIAIEEDHILIIVENIDSFNSWLADFSKSNTIL